VHIPHTCAIPTHFKPGCMFPGALNYAPGSSEPSFCHYPTSGCTDPSAVNYHSLATIDDGNCLPAVRGCTLPAVSRFIASTNGSAPGGGRPTPRGLPSEMAPRSVGVPSMGMVPFAPYGAVVAHDPWANVLEGCVVAIEGCTDSTAANYDSKATVNQGSWCVPHVSGCMDPAAANYDPAATVADRSACEVGRRGCLLSAALNYDPRAVLPGLCFERTGGCLDRSALNFRCGYGGSHLTSACALDSSHAAVGGRTAAAIVTVHSRLACNYVNATAEEVFVDLVEREIENALASNVALANDGQVQFQLSMEYVADAAVEDVGTPTVESMHAEFTSLHPEQDASQVTVAVQTGSVIIIVTFTVVGAGQLRLTQSNLLPHTRSVEALNAFLAGTGAPTAVTLPRFNVTYGEVPPVPPSKAPLSVGATVGISLGGLVVVAGLIGLIVALAWLRRAKLKKAMVTVSPAPMGRPMGRAPAAAYVVAPPTSVGHGQVQADVPLHGQVRPQPPSPDSSPKRR